MQHLTEISRDFPRLHALSPLHAFLRGLSSSFSFSFRSLVLSFLFASSFPPYRRIMLLWPIVTLLNYICSQWDVIAIGLLTSGTSRASRIDIFSRSLSIVTFHWPSVCRMTIHVITYRIICASHMYITEFFSNKV